ANAQRVRRLLRRARRGARCPACHRRSPARGGDGQRGLDYALSPGGTTPHMAKVALVTGANGGIGLAIAQRLLADGYALGYATAGKDESYKAPYDELRVRNGDDRIAWVYGDLTDPKVPERLVAKTVDAFGQIDVLVSNAGLTTAKPFLDLTLDDFDVTFQVDVRASFLLAQAATRRMRGGSIVN